MTRKEYLTESDRLNARINEIKEEIQNLRKIYFTEVLERNGYHIGQKISVKGKEYAIGGFDTSTPCIWVLGYPIKKDGTPSKKLENIYSFHLNEE